MDRSGIVDIGTQMTGIQRILQFYFGILLLARVVSSETTRCQRAKDVASVGRCLWRSTIATIELSVHELDGNGKTRSFGASFSEQRPMASNSREMYANQVRTAIGLLALVALAVCQPAVAQTSVWNGTVAGDPWGTAANWTPIAVPNDIFGATARFDGTGAGVPSVAALFSANYSVSGLQINQPGSVWSLGSGSDTGELNVGSGGIVFDSGSVGVATINYRMNANYAQTWDSSGATIDMYGVLNGGGTITKSGSGILVIDSNNFTDSGINRFVGGFNVTTGTLQAGSTMFDSARQTLRSNAVNLASGTSLTTVGTSAALSALKVGQISGSGSVTPGSNGAITIVALGDAVLSGSITTTGGLTLQGNNGTTQTFSGNVTGLTGTIGIHSGATLTLSGTGDSTSGVLGPNTGSGTPIALRGGALVLDNSAGNTSATNGRLSNGTAVTFLGGTLSLVGNNAGSSEAVAAMTVQSGGQATINVTHDVGSVGPTVLTGASLVRASGTTGTVDFTNSGGTLGTSGNNPRIIFTSAPGLTNGVIAQSGGSGVLGFATVNGTSFAGYDATNGVVPITTSAFPGTSSSTTNALLTTSGNTNGSASPFSLNTLTIAPSGAGQSLDINGSGNLNVVAFLLRGSSTDFSIIASGAGGISGGATRIFQIPDVGALLTVSARLTGATGNGINKAGLGTLVLTANNSTITGATTISAGAIRSSVANLPGSVLNLRGGVFEISGGMDGSGASADFTRALGIASGQVNWTTGSTDRGEGGFSANGGNASISIGGASPTTLQWNVGRFLGNGFALKFGSVTANARITLANNIELDNGSLTNEYFAREIRVIDNASSSSDLARLSGVISGSANADLLKTGAGTLELTNTNTYTGNTLIAAGTLALGIDHAIANSATAVVMGGTLDVGSFNQNMKAVNLVSGSIAGSGGTITGTSYLVQSGSISANLAGSGTVMNKTTSSTVTLTGANTFSGGANVAAGTLLVSNASGSGTGSGLVNVSGSTAVLGGGNASGTLGFISGPVSIHNSATLHPGMSNAIGVLTVNNNVTIGNAADNSNAGSKGTFHVQISSDASTSDLLLIGGASSALNFVTIGADSSTPTNTEVFVDFGLVSGSPFVENTTYTYTIATTSNSTNSGIYVNGTEGSLSSIVLASNYAGPATYSLSRMGKNLILSFTPIPEPGFVTAIFAAGLGGIGAFRRCRLRRKTAQQGHSLSL